MADSSPFLAALNAPKAPLPSASIGQYVPTTPTPFSPKSAAAVNPMLAPQFDTSYAPQTPSYSSSQFSPVNVPTFQTFGSSYAPQQSYGGGSAPRSNGNVSAQPQQVEKVQQMPALQDFSQQQFQVQAPFQSQTFTPSSFNGERSGVNLSPIDRTSETIGAPTRDLSTGQIAQTPLQQDVAFDESGRGSINGVPLYTGTANRVETLGQNVAAIEAVAGPEAKTPTDPSLSRVNRFFEESIPNAVDKFVSLFDPLANAANAYSDTAKARWETQGKGTSDTFRKIASAGDYLLAENSPSVSESFESRGGRNLVSPESAVRMGVPDRADPNLLKEFLSPAQVPATTPAPTPAVNQFNVDQNASANIMNPSSGNAFENQSNVLTAPAQSAIAQDPNSLFNVEPTAATVAPQAVAPAVVGQQIKQLTTPEDPIINGLTGIINVRGKDYGYIGGSSTPVEVTPERKAAFEKRAAEFRALNEIDTAVQPIDAQGNKMEFKTRSDPSNWTPREKKNFEETGDLNMSAAGQRAWNAGAPARAREEAKRVAKNEKADRAKAREREKEDRISENKRTPQTMKQRRAFELELDKEYKEMARYEDQQAAANSRFNLQQQMEQQKLALTASYQNRQLAAGEAEAAATAAYRAASAAKPSKTQEELNIINSLPISRTKKCTNIWASWRRCVRLSRWNGNNFSYTNTSKSNCGRK